MQFILSAPQMSYFDDLILDDGEGLHIVGPITERRTMKDAFNNEVAVLADVPGVWARLWTDAPLDQLDEAITIYHYSDALDAWTTDGETAAPDYVKTVAA